jgi:hypothetical protein
LSTGEKSRSVQRECAKKPEEVDKCDDSSQEALDRWIKMVGNGGVKKVTGTRCYCDKDLCNKCGARYGESDDCDYVTEGNGLEGPPASAPSKATKLQVKVWTGVMSMILSLILQITS